MIGAPPSQAVSRWREKELVEGANLSIRQALERSRTPAVTCSMQLGGLILLHLLRQYTKDIPVIFVDTGYHFPETLALRDEVAAAWDLNLIVATSEMSLPQHESLLGTLYVSNPDGCCDLRKVAPADRALDGHDTWFAAVRSSQSDYRSRIQPVEEHCLSTGSNITKIHPLLEWTWADVVAYSEIHEVPRHPLYDRGYTSIGCAPCTSPTLGDGDDRSGRWENGGTKTECGLHIRSVRDAR